VSVEPLVSVVVPTRNRGHLLPSALTTALEQTFDDYEIVVSDNFSADGTGDVVRERGSERIRYVRTDRTLSMPDHWEFAFDQARGRYVAFLCDDDAWAPTALERMVDALERWDAPTVAVRSSCYFAPNWLDPSMRNVVLLWRATGEELEMDSAYVLDALFKCRLVAKSPRMLNSLSRRDAVDAIRRETGRIFILCPDYSFAAAMLARYPSFVFIDDPLLAAGVFPEGIGSRGFFDLGGPAQEFADEFEVELLHPHMPLTVPSITNNLAETYEQVKERLPEELAGREVDMIAYFVGCWSDLATFEQNGTDVSAARREFLGVLGQQTEAIQAAVRPQLEAVGRRSQLRREIRRQIGKSGLLTRLEFTRRGLAEPRETLVKGDRAGFQNIVECARKLGELPRLGPVERIPGAVERRAADVALGTH
jgi:hypothetical protein